VTLPFLEGTQPTLFCDIHEKKSPHQSSIPVFTTELGVNDPSLWKELPMPSMDWDQFPELRNAPQQRNNRNSQNTAARGSTNSRNTTTQAPSSSLFNNPHLDSDVPAPARNEPPPKEQTTDLLFVAPSSIHVVPEHEEEAISDDDAYADLPSWNPLE